MISDLLYDCHVDLLEYVYDDTSEMYSESFLKRIEKLANKMHMYQAYLDQPSDLVINNFTLFCIWWRLWGRRAYQKACGEMKLEDILNQE